MQPLSSEGLIQRSKEEAKMYIRVLQQNPGSWNIKRLLLSKENWSSQFSNEFSAFFCMGR